MSGAYTHLVIANLARAGAAKANLRKQTKLALGLHLRYVELGAVGPDYPYLALDRGQTKWADAMHYRSTAMLLRSAVDEVRNTPVTSQGKLTAWLLGMAAHIGTDMTIHPVVELKVGPYEANKSAHRQCEMHQDAYIFPRMNLGEVAFSEHLRSGLATCHEPGDADTLDADIQGAWKRILFKAYADLHAADLPDPSSWHRGFRRVLLTMAGANHLVPFARHVGVSLNLAYPKVSEVDPRYVRGLKTPEGVMDFDALFERALSNVLAIWEGLDAAIGGTGAATLEQLEDWNLDTGRSLKTGKLVFWKEQK